jgi:hypothetical protein
MVLRDRSDIRAIDPALRRQRLRDRVNRRGARLQATATTARTPIIGLSTCGRRCCVSGKLSDITRQLLAELDVEAETQRVRIGKRDRDPPLLLSVAFVLEHLLDLVAQLRRVLVPVNGDGMQHRCVEHFFFRTGDFQGAIVFARVIPAIDGFSLPHITLLLVLGFV